MKSKTKTTYIFKGHPSSQRDSSKWPYHTQEIAVGMCRRTPVSRVWMRPLCLPAQGFTLALQSAGWASQIPMGSHSPWSFPPIPPFPCFTAHLILTWSGKELSAMPETFHNTSLNFCGRKKKWTRITVPAMGRAEGTEESNF